MTIYAMPARPYAQSTPTVGTTGAFAAWLRAARTRKGWSGERLAEEVETSQGTISMYERGLRQPQRERAVELATALGADPREALEALMADTPGLEPLPELEREPDEEYLQDSIMAYSGPNPILSAAAATARSMKQLFDNAGPELTGDEPKDVLVRGRRKGITKADGK